MRGEGLEFRVQGLVFRFWFFYHQDSAAWIVDPYPTAEIFRAHRSTSGSSRLRSDEGVLVGAADSSDGSCPGAVDVVALGDV